MLSREPGCFSYALPESTEVEGFSSLSMHRVSRSIAPRCSKFCWDGCELTVFEYQGWPYEWPYSHLMMCSVWWVKDVSFVSCHWIGHINIKLPMQNGSLIICFVELNASWGWIMFSISRVIWSGTSHLPWIFIDWYYSLLALLKSTDQKSPKQMVVSVICMTGCQNHQVVTDCFGCHILWLLARNNSTCRQRRCGRKRYWIDYPYPETEEQLNICSWWCMVPGTRYCIV